MGKALMILVRQFQWVSRITQAPKHADVVMAYTRNISKEHRPVSVKEKV